MSIFTKKKKEPIYDTIPKTPIMTGRKGNEETEMYVQGLKLFVEKKGSEYVQEIYLHELMKIAEVSE